MNKKTFVVFFLGLIFIFSCVGCTASENSASEEVISSITENVTESIANLDEVIEKIPIVDENNTRYISNSLDRLKIYSSLKDLEVDSQNIFTGICISSEPVFQNRFFYTLSEIRVQEVFKGNLAIGETILVFEIGGRSTFGEYRKGMQFEPKVFEEGAESLPDDYNIVSGFDGFFPLKENEEGLFFVVDETGFFEDVKGPMYGITGLYDGKLYLQEDGIYVRPLSNNKDELKFGEDTLTITVDELNALKQ